MTTWEEFRKLHESLMAELERKQVPLNEIWLQAKCKCEYCDIDLLERPETDRGADSDHILPKFRYPRLKESLSNYAMACASCHKLKGQFDPGENDPKFKESNDLTDADREQLIHKVKRYLAPRRLKQAEDTRKIISVLSHHGLRP